LLEGGDAAAEFGPPEREQPTAQPQDRIGIGALARHVAHRMIRHRKPRRHARSGEAAAGRAIPRHGRPGPVTVAVRAGPARRRIPALGDGHIDVGHADLVAVVQHGGAGQGGQDH
jgi:hypothetical protein